MLWACENHHCALPITVSRQQVMELMEDREDEFYAAMASFMAHGWDDSAQPSQSDINPQSSGFVDAPAHGQPSGRKKASPLTESAKRRLGQEQDKGKQDDETWDQLAERLQLRSDDRSIVNGTRLKSLWRTAPGQDKDQHQCAYGRDKGVRCVNPTVGRAVVKKVVQWQSVSDNATLLSHLDEPGLGLE